MPFCHKFLEIAFRWAARAMNQASFVTAHMCVVYPRQIDPELCRAAFSSVAWKPIQRAWNWSPAYALLPVLVLCIRVVRIEGRLLDWRCANRVCGVDQLRRGPRRRHSAEEARLAKTLIGHALLM